MTLTGLQVVCSKCSVIKKLIIDTENDVVRKPFTFCLKCLHVAKEVPAVTVVRDEVGQRNTPLNRT